MGYHIGARIMEAYKKSYALQTCITKKIASVRKSTQIHQLLVMFGEVQDPATDSLFELDPEDHLGPFLLQLSM